MSKEKLLRNIEEGLLNYYLDKDHSVDIKVNGSTPAAERTLKKLKAKLKKLKAS